MKKFLYTIFAAAAVAFSASSCTEDGFLKEEMVATITQQYYESETGLNALVTGMYDHLRIMWMRDTYSCGLWSDNNDLGGANEYSPSSYTASGSSKIGAFVMHYQANPYYQRWGAYACYNDALTIIDIIDNKASQLGGSYADAEYCAKQKATAYFAKDWMLYVLSSMMGDVYIPQTRTVSDTGIYYAPRSTSEELFKMFISDMEYAYKHLPTASSIGNTSTRSEYLTKGAAAMMLARFYLDIALGEKHAALRNADGSFKQGELDALGMLYKGKPTSYNDKNGASVAGSAADACIYWASEVISMGDYDLEDDYSTFGQKVKGSTADENSREIIWSMAASHNYQGEKNNNGAWGWRTEDYYGRYTSSYFGTNMRAWEYGSHKGYHGITDWGFQVFTNKFNDSRYAKTFFLELYPKKVSGRDDIAYDSYLSNNGGAKWLENVNPFTKSDATKKNQYVDWFNTNKATYFGASSPFASRVDAVVSGANYTTNSNAKLNNGDVSVVFIANDRDHAIDADLCHSMPFIVCPFWCYYTDAAGEKHYYTGTQSYQVMSGNPSTGSVDASLVASGRAYVKKYIDPDRTAINSETAGRNVTVLRLADAYLMRAWAKGLKGDYAGAVTDINVIRERAGYKAGETRPMAVAQFADYYDGGAALTTAEKQYPYEVAASTKDAMKITTAAWTVGTAEFEAENYPHYLTSSITADNGSTIDVYNNNAGFTDAEAFYFSNFMANEYAREFMGETVNAFVQQFSGLRYTRLLWHNQKASVISKDENGADIWPAKAENSKDNLYQNGKARGYIRPYMIWEPITYDFTNALTDENGKPLTTDAVRAYQNPGYVE